MCRAFCHYANGATDATDRDQGSGGCRSVTRCCSLFAGRHVCVFAGRLPPKQTWIPAWAKIEPLEFEDDAVQQLLLDPPVDVWPGFGVALEPVLRYIALQCPQYPEAFRWVKYIARRMSGSVLPSNDMPQHIGSGKFSMVAWGGCTGAGFLAAVQEVTQRCVCCVHVCVG